MLSRSMFYVVSRAKTEDGGGIHRFAWKDAPGGAVPEIVGFTPVDRCNWIAFSPNRRTLYATCTLNGDAEGEGGVAAFAVSPEDGALTPCGVLATGGKAPCHLTTDPSGRFLFVANYLGGNVSVFRLTPEGGLASRIALHPHTGHGPDASRQEGPHPHYTGLTPDGRFLSVVDLGIDRIVTYPLDAERGINPAGRMDSAVTSPGAGPRHLVFADNGKIVYLLNELANTVQSLHYANGQYTPLAEVSLLPSTVNQYSKAAAVRLSRDGRFLYATNRGFDTVVVFALDGAGGLTRVESVFSGGDSPRDAHILPGDDLFATANESSNRLVLFHRDSESGRLTPHGAVFPMPQPLCILV